MPGLYLAGNLVANLWNKFKCGQLRNIKSNLKFDGKRGEILFQIFFYKKQYGNFLFILFENISWEYF